MSDETPNPADRKPAAAPEGSASEGGAPSSTPDPAPAASRTAPASDPAVDAAPDVEVVPTGAEPVPVTSDPAAVPAEPAVAADEQPTPTAEPESAPAATASGAAPADTPDARRVVYLETPAAPRVRGNRLVGTLLALVGAVVYAGLLALVGALLYAAIGRELFGEEFGAFVASAAFWVPVLVFALAFILQVLIVNRGGWAAHVFISLVLAFVVYFASIGLLLLVGDVITQQHVTFERIALTPQIIASAIVAREVAIWMGLAIARRGRSVRERNAEARATYEQELAEQRAQFARQSSSPGADV